MHSILNRCFTFCFLVTCACVFSACATLPAGVSVPESRQLEIKQSFTDFIASQQGCVDQVDADVAVSFQNVLYNGKIDGYLQAMQPGYLRFDGLNAFGLTEMIFSTDGQDFTFVAVRKEIGYSGPVAAEKFQRYVPQTFVDDGVFLLNGLVATREDFTLTQVRGEEDGLGFWIDLHYAGSGKSTTVLYQPDSQKIDQVIMIPKKGSKTVFVTYQYPSDRLITSCPEPESIQVASNGNGEVLVQFSKRYPLSPLKKGNFQVAIPSNYKKVFIQ